MNALPEWICLARITEFELPGWTWLIFVFAFGACVGSFLNVVIWRLPRDKSLVRPPSACPGCGNLIHWHDNIPILSWLLLRGRCRRCGMGISIRYPVIELVTALLFLGLYAIYFLADIRGLGYGDTIGLTGFKDGGWLLFTCHILLLSALLAASAIDLELWVIPLHLCWFVTAIGVAGSAAAPWVLNPQIITTFRLFPSATPTIGILTLGAMLGLAAALVLLKKGIIKPSYPNQEAFLPETEANPAAPEDDTIPHRREILKEIVFLSPIILGAMITLAVYRLIPAVERGWDQVMACPMAAGLFGGLWGYLIGCGVVWATRILGTLAFGREAMGLGDVHLMGAAGTLLGAEMIVVAFFVAPFFGLVWASVQWLSRKTRQIPYGPFLSLAVGLVMIAHDWFWDYWSRLFCWRSF
jgi:leader peptidase (prepilin peptidase)/N-methyltransferase